MLYIKKYCRVLLNIIVPIIILALIIRYGIWLLVFFMPFVIAILIAMVANPLVHYLEKRIKLKREHSSVILIILVLAGIFAIIYFGGKWALTETIYFAKTLPNIYAQFLGDLEAANARLSNVYALFPDATRQTIKNVLGSTDTYISSIVQRLASPTAQVAGGVISSIPVVLVYTVVSILASYIFIADSDKISEYLNSHIPYSIRKYIDYIKRDISYAIGGYFRAQFRILFVVAFIMVVGLAILRVPYYAIIGILVAVLDFLPVFGTGAVLWPWAAIKLIAGDYIYAAALMAIWVVTQVVRQVIQPKIMGDSLGLSPIYTLLCLFLGFKLRGLGGMIIAVPIGMVFLRLYKYGIFDGFINNIKILVTDIYRFMKGKDIEI